jgi:hypothetical protein
MSSFLFYLRSDRYIRGSFNRSNIHSGQVLKHHQATEVDIKAKAVVEQTKRELTLKLINRGKTPTQIREYLEAFGYI